MITNKEVCMKRLFLLLSGLAVCAFFAGQSFAAQTQDVGMKVPSKPAIDTLVGTTKFSSPANRYPEFTAFGSPANPSAACQAALQAKNNSYIDPAMAFTPPAFPDPKYYIAIGNGMPTDVAIPERSRKDAKLIINWTMVVLLDPDANAGVPSDQRTTGPGSPCPAANTCYNCVSTQVQKGGLVFVQLYVNDVPKGSPVKYNLPGPVTKYYQGPPPPPPPRRSGDPTLSGTFTLTKDDPQFGGTLPAKVKIQLKWFNDTSMPIQTPANQHVITVYTEPVS